MTSIAAAGRQSRFFVDAAGVSLHFLMHGTSGPNILLLPGITSPAISWAFASERLAERARVYTLDNRGRGLSDRGPSLTYDLDDYAADVDHLVRALGIGPVILVGHSMGARIAIRTAARFPGVATHVVLADPPISGPGRRPYPIPLKFYLANLAAARRGEMLPSPPGWTDAQCRVRAEWLPSCSDEAVVGSYRSMHEEDIHADMPSIKVPVDLIYAEQGGTITREDADEIVALIPNARSRLISGVGHMMPWDNLEAFVSAVFSVLGLDISGEPAHKKGERDGSN
ncbi:MAG: alpha/beta fold hydrolase [Hyphomicrobiaceae bacterium]